MSTRAEELLRQVFNNYYGEEMRSYERRTGKRLTWEDFVLEDAFAYNIVQSLHPMPEEMAAALDCLRNKAVAQIDALVQHLKAEAAKTPTPAWILHR
jgi:hypothetical protein